ncbi:MAG: hypothetical protein QMC95_06540 [Desulfitobacteriaceae bacterium]|nr:hypothetical protein [Desulfitobacteriaceae bacterium]
MINGKVYDWESVTISLPTGVVIGIDSVEYKDSKEKEMVYGKGAMPVGRGEGNYKAEGKITLLRDEYQNLLDYCKMIGKSFYKIPPFPITASYANDGEKTRVDVVKGVTFTERSQSMKQGDKSLTKELSFIAEKIVEDGVEPV